MNHEARPTADRHTDCRARTDSGHVIPRDSLSQAAEREKALKRLRKLRTKAADEIDRLLEFFDAVDDTDVDSQCDDNPIDDLETEPSLGWTDAQAKSNRHSDFAGNDCELDTCDDEPSLGSLERPVSCYGPDGPNPTGDQTNWTWGGTDDREDEHDGREPSEDDEPSLGSTSTTINQEAWSFGSNADREQGTTRCFREGPKKIEKVD